MPAARSIRHGSTILEGIIVEMWEKHNTLSKIVWDINQGLNWGGSDRGLGYRAIGIFEKWVTEQIRKIAYIEWFFVILCMIMQ